MNKFRERLLKLQLELEGSLKRAQSSSQPVELDQSKVGRVSRIDAIQQQQQHLAAAHRIRIRLKKIDASLQKIDQNIYGVCQLCEEPIGEARLEIQPETPVCIECMKNSEK